MYTDSNGFMSNDNDEKVKESFFMVIGIFTDTFFPEISGVSSSVLLLKRELEKKGHAVYVFTVSNPALRNVPDEDNTYRLPSAPFIFLPSRRFAVVYKKSVAHQIGKLNLDVIHTNTEFSLGFFGKLVAASLNKPVIHTYHTLYKDYVHYITKGHFPNISADMARTYSRIYCNSCCRIVTPTEKTRDLLLEYDVERPIDIIPTGIDIGQFRPAADDAEKIGRIKAELGIGPYERVLLSVGRIAKEKSIDAIVRQLPQYFKTHKNDKLLIVGDGPYRPDIEALAKSLGISDRVVLAGERPWSEIALFYKLGSVFVSASLSETQGLTFIEAMAAGIPVLAKKDRSVDKIVIDGYSGCLFDDDSRIPALLDKIQGDMPFRAKLIANAYDIAAQNSSEQFAEKIEKLYMKTIHEWDWLDKKYILSNRLIKKILL
jgi:1,2-diacylglycerol 3-alpha-glucosyltransferase